MFHLNEVTEGPTTGSPTVISKGRQFKWTDSPGPSPSPFTGPLLSLSLGNFPTVILPLTNFWREGLSPSSAALQTLIRGSGNEIGQNPHHISCQLSLRRSWSLWSPVWRLIQLWATGTCPDLWRVQGNIPPTVFQPSSPSHLSHSWEPKDSLNPTVHDSFKWRGKNQLIFKSLQLVTTLPKKAWNILPPDCNGQNGCICFLKSKHDRMWADWQDKSDTMRGSCWCHICTNVTSWHSDESCGDKSPSQGNYVFCHVDTRDTWHQGGPTDIMFPFPRTERTHFKSLIHSTHYCQYCVVDRFSD